MMRRASSLGRRCAALCCLFSGAGLTSARAGTQGGLSGEQFENLYRYYRDVYAQAR